MLNLFLRIYKVWKFFEIGLKKNSLRPAQLENVDYATAESLDVFANIAYESSASHC